MNTILTAQRCPQNTMNRQHRTFPRTWRYRLPSILLLAVLATTGTSSYGARIDTSPMAFATPAQAANALDDAWHSDNQNKLLAIFGAAGTALVSSGDPQAEQQARAQLAAAYAEDHHIDTDSSGQAILILGRNAWPYPIPLVNQGGQWRFDVKAGAEQIIDRRIGRNELHAIGVCGVYVEAQRDYAASGNGLHEYAQRVASSKGVHDGLYWPASEGSRESPLGPLVAAAEAQGYGMASAEGRAPFQGYYYRILTSQGAHAPGGARNYIVNGHMTGGYALVAFPVKYRDSGVMTFLVNQDGIVFEKNLGPRTGAIAGQMTQYDPDSSWAIAQP